MTRSFALAALASLLFTTTGLHRAAAEEPKATGTVDISSSVPDLEKLQAFSGTGVILDQKEWERLAAAWGIKEVAQVDFTKELLLVGTWRGNNFKFLGDIKNGDLIVEQVGDKEPQPGFRYKVLSLNRAGITKFQGKALPAATASDLKPIEEKPSVDLSGSIRDESLQNQMPLNGVITSQEQWERLAKVWGITNPPPVDFTRQWLVVGTSRGTSFSLNPVVTNGDLVISTKGATDLAPGFRWRVRAINREGIKTLNGKAFNPAPTNPPPQNSPPVSPPPKNKPLPPVPPQNSPPVSPPPKNGPNP
jgi:hypothetical protein